MNFSEDWEQRYAGNSHLAVWPWSDLVSLVCRHCPDLRGARVLELGCGAGANIPFFQSQGAQYYGIDGSPTIIRRLKERFPELVQRIVLADFACELPFDAGFELIVDRAAVTHNTSAAIAATLDSCWRALRNGGFFIGVDWFSTHCTDYERGEPDADPYTRRGYQHGPFAGTGRVHFADLGHIRALFERFELLLLEEKQVRAVLPENHGQLAVWNLVARKRT